MCSAANTFNRLTDNSLGSTRINAYRLTADPLLNSLQKPPKTSIAMNLAYLVDHLFLPPKLPQEDDSTLGGPQALLLHVKESTTGFVHKLGDMNVDGDIIRSWAHLPKTFQWTDDLHVNDFLPLESSTGPLVAWMLTVRFLFQLQFPLTYFFHSDVLVLHIAAQDAGVIIWKLNMSHLTLEFFQASPTASRQPPTASRRRRCIHRRKTFYAVPFPPTPLLSNRPLRHTISLCTPR